MAPKFTLYPFFPCSVLWEPDFSARLHPDSLTSDFLGIGLMERYWKTGEASGLILIPPLLVSLPDWGLDTSLTTALFKLPLFWPNSSLTRIPCSRPLTLQVQGWLLCFAVESSLLPPHAILVSQTVHIFCESLLIKKLFHYTVWDCHQCLLIFWVTH